MTIIPAVVGRKPSGTDAGFGFFGTNTIRATTFNRVNQNLWVREIKGRMGSYTGVDILAWLVAYRGTSAHVPDSRIGYVGSFTIPGSTMMTSGANGADFGGPIGHVDTAFRAVGWEAGDAAMLRADSYPSIGIENDGGGTLGHGMIAAANIGYPADDTRFFILSNDGTPPNPFGTGYSTVNEGHLSVWLECDVNIKPHTPVNRTETNLNTLTPTFWADFRDDNGAYGGATDGRDVGDSLYRVNIIIRNAAGSAIRNVNYYATTGERNANRSQWVYDGGTLTAGNTYTWEIRHADQFNEWGPWSEPKEFTPSNTGTVTLTGPTGKQLVNNPSITGSYSHPSATAATQARVIIRQGGANIRDSGWFNKAVSSGANWTVTFADAGISALAWGGSYQARVAMRTAALIETPYGTRDFTTDAPPSTPSGLYPTGDVVVTAYPLIYAYASDPDNIPSTLTVKAIITRLSNMSTATVTLAYNSGAGRFEFQTTGTQIPATGSYSWVAYSGDGTLWSGGVTVEGSAEKSDPAVFTYSTGPAVDITYPVDSGTFDTSTPTVTWTAATQVERRVIVRRAGAVIYELPREPSVVKSHPIPPGYIDTDGTVYSFEVTVWDAGSQVGTDQVTATLDYDEPAAVTGFEAAPHVIGTDPYPAAIRLVWDESSNPLFYAYVVKRDGVLMAVVTNVLSTTWIDYAPISDQLHEYTVQVMVADDLTAVGALASSEASIHIDGFVIHNVDDPDGLRIAVRTWERREEDRQGTEEAYLTWGANAPVTVAGEATWGQMQVDALLGIENGSGTGREQRAMVNALHKAGGPHYYRDASGAAFLCTIPAAGGVRIASLRHDRFAASITLREEAI